MKCCVLLPVYNAGPSLREAIQSILAQDEPDFEFLIIDDGSRDASPQVIRDHAARDSRIRSVFHQKNQGLAATLNEGLGEARSDLVVRMDQDDESLPHRIRTQIQFLESHPAVAVAGSFVYHMGKRPKYDRLIALPTGHEEIARALAQANCIYHPSVILRRDRILALGGYRREFKNAEDYDLWIRASKAYRLANIPVPLLRYRFSTNGMTLGKKWQQMFYVQMALIARSAPGLTHAELVKAAGEALEKVDKQWFLQQVASGTIQELTQLRRWWDGFRAFLLFSRQLEPGRSFALARQFFSSAYFIWRRERRVS
jgi:hypothetical protein